MHEESSTSEWLDVVELLSPTEFRDIALIFLRHRYDSSVELVDGTGDGGVDAWIVLDAARDVRLAAQFHAGQGAAWYTKLEHDLRRLRVAHPNVRNLVYVCGQKTAAQKVVQEETRVFLDHDVTVRILDARAIASQALDPEVRHEYLRALPTRRRDQPVLDDPRQATILAHAFFDDGVASFRMTVVRSAILVQLQAGGLPRAELIRRVEDIVGPAAQRFIKRVIDALLTEHKLIEDREQTLVCDPASRDELRTILALQDRRRTKLVEDCVHALASSVHDPDRGRSLAHALVDRLGTLWLEEARRRGCGPGDAQQGIDAEIRKQLVAIESLIHTHTKPSGDTRAAFDRIMRVVAASPYARSLAAGELYRSWTALDRTDLAMALGERTSLIVLLDTSVVMPLFCARFHAVASGYYPSETAAALYDVTHSRGLSLIVPDVYVEEMAAHWIDAWRFAELAGSDPSLARSENFFVAQYHSVHADASREGFEYFLEGCSHRLSATGPNAFLHERARAEQTFAHLLAVYCGVEVRACPKSSQDARSVEGPPGRDDRVTDHDRRVVAWLQDRTGFAMSTTVVLCTWDLWLRNGNSLRPWLALDPGSLADLLELLRPAEERRPLVNIRAIAAAIHDEDAQRAAEIYDRIVRFPHNMPSALAYRQAAIAFKTEWLVRRPHELPSEADWQSFIVAGRYERLS